MVGIKQMAPLYTAFDRTTYSRLIPRHLHDLLTFPPEVLQAFSEGAFSVWLSTRQFCSVGLDEAHEMKINKECKAAIVRPSKENMHTLSNTIQFRASMVTSLTTELFPERSKRHTKEAITLKPSLTQQKVEENIEAMATAVRSSGMLARVETNRGLANFFTNTHATPEQRHDLLQYRKIGQADYDAHVNYRLLKSPSSKAPTRQRKLSTFATSAVRSKREKKLKSDTKLINNCMKKKIAWMTATGMCPGQIDEVYTETPKALMGADGLPNKGRKSSTTA